MQHMHMHIGHAGLQMGYSVYYLTTYMRHMHMHIRHRGLYLTICGTCTCTFGMLACRWFMQSGVCYLTICSTYTDAHAHWAGWRADWEYSLGSIPNYMQHMHMYTGQAGERIGNTVWVLYLAIFCTCRWGLQPGKSAKVPDHFRNGKSPSSLCPLSSHPSAANFKLSYGVINVPVVYMVRDVYDFDAGKSILRAHTFKWLKKWNCLHENH
jgi:hypothetical protein